MRIALIWFSCFCCASENFSLMPASSAASLIDLVLAVRQPLSAPTWEKPMVIDFAACWWLTGLLAAPPTRMAASEAMQATAVMNLLFDTYSSSSVDATVAHELESCRNT